MDAQHKYLMALLIKINWNLVNNVPIYGNATKRSYRKLMQNETTRQWNLLIKFLLAISRVLQELTAICINRN